MSAREQQRQLVEHFAIIEDRQERLAAVVDRARTVPRLPDELRTDAHLVPGCTSRVWLAASCADGRCRFVYDCDSPLVKGLVSVLIDSYQDCAPADIIATEATALAELGLLRDLSPTRQTGLAAVRRRLVDLAHSAQ